MDLAIDEICNGDYSKFKCLYESDQRFFLDLSKYVKTSGNGNTETADKILSNCQQYLSPYCWKNKEFPVYKENVNYLKLPNGDVLKDACIWENFLQDELNMDPQKLLDNLLKYRKHPDDVPLEFNKKGDDPYWLSGKHKSLNYRGNALKRSKMWLQKDYKKGFLKYGYTGWQHSVSYAAKDIKYVKEISKLNSKLNKDITSPQMNHWIATLYKDGDDYIGFHSDKKQDFVDNSYFIIIKLGAQRVFEFRLKPNNTNDKVIPFYKKVLNQGTAIFVRVNCMELDSNSIVQHGVPQQKEHIGISGSLVGRSIKTIIKWDDVHKNIKKSELSKKKSKEKKSKKSEFSKKKSKEKKISSKEINDTMPLDLRKLIFGYLEPECIVFDKNTIDKIEDELINQYEMFFPHLTNFLSSNIMKDTTKESGYSCYTIKDKFDDVKDPEKFMSDNYDDIKVFKSVLKNSIIATAKVMTDITHSIDFSINSFTIYFIIKNMRNMSEEELKHHRKENSEYYDLESEEEDDDTLYSEYYDLESVEEDDTSYSE